ncbi:hypothetical protein [Pelomonas sp. SE-A7]|uniref:hypothetical protein n=1 Tax=Pelomonas sp. SE-A7 TaxID=3054953 RepID=UPI00259CAB23|nr:hypothetical protein [Pelomonas sp. SE-A7]MDM4768446.1 hypothetical protein [Pelomonas sp. SE-A7]
MRQTLSRLVGLLTAASLVAAAPLAQAAEACYANNDESGQFASTAEDGKELTRELWNSYVEQMNSAQRTVARCYQRAMQRESDIAKGNKQIKFGIQVEADGKVSRVAVLKSDYNDGMLHACLGEMVCGFKLQAGGQARKFIQPFGMDTRYRLPEKMDDFRDARKL